MTSSWILPVAILLAALAPAAAADGINLVWSDCFDGGGLSNVNDACNADAGSPHRLVISIRTTNVHEQITGASGTVYLQFDGPVAPSFWHLQPGGARHGALSIDPFVGSTSAPFACDEAWSQAGAQTAGVTYALGPLPNEARIDWSVSVPAGVTFLAETEYYIAALDFSRAGTTTTSGCGAGACLVLGAVVLQRPAEAGSDVALCHAADAQHVTWQAGGALSCPPFHFNPECPTPTPTLDRSWGRVKQMYR